MRICILMRRHSNLSDSWKRQPLTLREEEIQEMLCSDSEEGAFLLFCSSEMLHYRMNLDNAQACTLSNLLCGF